MLAAALRNLPAYCAARQQRKAMATYRNGSCCKQRLTSGAGSRLLAACGITSAKHQ